jgi:8-oxo-dGTP pyrophosphatase MutT (NUDIX family)
MVTKIFFEDKPVFLCNEITPSIQELIHHPDTIFLDEISTPAIKSLIHEIVKSEYNSAILLQKDIKKLKKVFFKQFTIIQAAGGLVKNEQNEILFIFRRGKWDLPKGKNDGDEISKECAIREVKEETGLQTVIVGKKICTTYHTYTEFGKNLLKETEWFEMTSTLEQKLAPQQDEGIEKIEWVNEVGLNEKLKNSFPLIFDVILTSGIDVKA